MLALTTKLAGFFGMNPDPTPITKRLRAAQQHSDATLHLLHQAGRVELYQRRRPRHDPDFACVRGRLVGHGLTPSQALAAVRAQLHAEQASSMQPLSWRDGLSAGLTSVCLHQFCQAYHLAPTATLSRAELKHLLSQPGTPHRQQFIRAARRFGIHLQ